MRIESPVFSCTAEGDAGEGGYVLVSMLVPIVGVALLIAVGLFLFAPPFASLPPSVQTVLKVVGVIAILAFMIVATRSGGKGRGF